MARPLKKELFCGFPIAMFLLRYHRVPAIYHTMETLGGKYHNCVCVLVAEPDGPDKVKGFICSL